MTELMYMVLDATDPANKKEVKLVMDIKPSPVKVLLSLLQRMLLQSQADSAVSDKELAAMTVELQAQRTALVNGKCRLVQMTSRCLQTISEWIGSNQDTVYRFLEAEGMSILCSALQRAESGTEQCLTLTWTVVNVMFAQSLGGEECIAWLRRGVAPSLCAFPELFRGQQEEKDGAAEEEEAEMEITSEVLVKLVRILDVCESSGSALFTDAVRTTPSYKKAMAFVIKHLKNKRSLK
jgi:hypothetical protein